MKKIIPSGPLLIIFASVLWSMDGLLRRSIYVLPPLLVVFYEHLIGFLILVPFLLSHIKTLRDIQPKTWGALAWVTVFSSILGTLLYTAALGKVQYIQLSVVVLLQQLEPLIVLLFSRIVLKEPIHRRYIPWFFAALAAAYLISFPTLTVNWATGSGTILAALMAVGAAFSWGSSTVFSRMALLTMPSQLTTGIRFGLASVVALILLLVTGQGSVILQINESQLLVLVIIAMSTGMVALSIYYRGLKNTPAWISSLCELTWPLSAVVIDYVVFHKSLTFTQWIGTVMLLTSIFMVSKATREKTVVADLTT